MKEYVKGVFSTIANAVFTQNMDMARIVLNGYKIPHHFVCYLMDPWPNFVQAQFKWAMKAYIIQQIQKYVTEVFSIIANAVNTLTTGIAHTVQSGNQQLVVPSVFYRVALMLVVAPVQNNGEIKVYTGQQMTQHAQRVEITF